MCVCLCVRVTERERKRKEQGKRKDYYHHYFLVWGAAGFLPGGRFLDAPNSVPVAVSVSVSVCLCDPYFYSNA